jgi:hypothetical protein
MSNEVDEDIIVATDKICCIFLSICEKIPKKLYPDKSKSKIETSYSYLAVLHVVSIMKSYGSVRNVWEGSFQGEGILSKIKPLISDLRTNWHLNAGRKHHISKSMKIIMDKYVENSLKSYLPINHCCYLNIETVQRMLDDKVAISILHNSHDGYFIILENNLRVTLEVSSFKIKYFGMYYYRWMLKEECKRYDNDEMQVDFYALMLPLQKRDTNEYNEGDSCTDSNHYYAVITSDHKEMLQDGTIGKMSLYLMMMF